MRKPSAVREQSAVQNQFAVQKKAAVQKKKLLVLNVYFAPQSVGGATQIAQDQVRGLCEELGDSWEVTVLCTNPQP